ncbi:MAG TPA: ABC transporter permease [Chloroflexia bacterium]|nr:ABC transporter permease [Chloroflexia bacterium]
MSQLVETPVLIRPSATKKPTRNSPLARFFKDKLNLVAFVLFAVINLVSLSADFIAGSLLKQARDTIDTDLVMRSSLHPPFPPGLNGHILGTDELARDMLARTIYGGQVSLSVGYLTACVAVLLGGGLGLLAGYFGSWFDDIMTALIQILANLPLFFLMIILSFIVRFEVINISVLIGLLSWTGTARVVRAQAINLRNREYVEAARVLGASPFRIMRVHILPNVLSLMLVMVGFDVAAAIILEASLSVLNFGVTIPIPSWGNQLASGVSTGTPDAPWQFLPPAIAMSVTLVCIFIIANGLRDAFDKRSGGDK